MKKMILTLSLFVLAGILPGKVAAADLATGSSNLSFIPITDLFLPDQTEQSQDCAIYRDLIEKRMPSDVGNQRALGALLNVKTESWLTRLKGSEALEALGERGSFDGRFFENAVGSVRSETSLFKLNIMRGELRYINSSRKFNPGTDPGKAFGYEKGLQIVQNLLYLLGVPQNEIGELEGKVLMGAAIPVEERLQTTATRQLAETFELETTFFATRSINGIPVLNSYFVAGLSNRGEISRFRLRWPALVIDPNLQNATVISKGDLEDTILAALVEHNGCQTPETLKMQIVYFPTVMDVQDEDATVEELKPIVYAPKLLVFFRPENQEQSGEVLDFNLFRSAAER